MKRFLARKQQLLNQIALGVNTGTSCTALRFCAFSKADGAAGEKANEPGSSTAGSGEEGGKGPAGGSAMVADDGSKKRNMLVFSATNKAVYIHPWNKIAAWYWFHTDFHKWYTLIVVVFVGSQFMGRYYIARMATATQAQLGENLLDQRTRDLLSDIEKLRMRDPMRLENEANLFHELFWQRRAKHAAKQRTDQRTMEMQRGLLQGEARGTDMTEWLGAKVKDDEEREVARRTHDYIQGFHQHLKAKRLI